MSSAMDPTNQRIITNSASAARPTKKLTYHVLKLRKANYIHTPSSVPIVKAYIR